MLSTKLFNNELAKLETPMGIRLWLGAQGPFGDVK
jgi:hypothetical protein